MTEMLTVADVARLTSLSPYTVRAAIKDGDLVASKLRGRYLVHPDQLAAWIDDATVRPAGALSDRGDAPLTRPRPKPPTDTGRSIRDLLRESRRQAA